MCKENKELLKKVSQLVNLLAYDLVKDKSLPEGAPILKRLGFSNEELSKIYDKVPRSTMLGR